MGIDWEREVLQPLAEVFGLDDCAVTFYPKGGSAPYNIKPVFDEAYRDVMLLDVMAPTTDAKPVMGVPRHYFPGLPRDILYAQDFLRECKLRLVLPAIAAYTGVIGQDPIGGFAIGVEPPRWYIVKEAQLDGHGNVKLILMKTTPVP